MGRGKRLRVCWWVTLFTAGVFEAAVGADGGLGAGNITDGVAALGAGLGGRGGGGLLGWG
jgi:hypothetical protein